MDFPLVVIWHQAEFAGGTSPAQRRERTKCASDSLHHITGLHDSLYPGLLNLDSPFLPWLPSLERARQAMPVQMLPQLPAEAGFGQEEPQGPYQSRWGGGGGLMGRKTRDVGTEVKKTDFIPSSLLESL